MKFKLQTTKNKIITEAANGSIGSKIDYCIDNVLSKMGLDRSNCHRELDKNWDFHHRLDNELYANNIDLSYKRAVTPTGITVEGNTLGIASKCMQHLFDNRYKKVTMHRSELEEAANKAGIRIFMDRDYKAVKISAEVLLGYARQIGTRVHHRGIGSQASSVEETTEVLMNEFGDIYLSRSVMIWD